MPEGTIVADVGFPFSGATLNVPPLHIDVVSVGITGVGFTVTVKVKAGPGQVGVVGMTV